VALLLALLLGLGTTGCSIIHKKVTAKVSETLGGLADSFAADGDPELVADALPFALKTSESFLLQSPEDVDLLLGNCQGFALYGYAFVELPAERLEVVDYRAARDQHRRALDLILRARDYCLDAFELTHPGTVRALQMDPASALADAGKEDVPLLYWTAATWGAAIALGLDRPELVIDLPAVRALLRRSLELDPDWNRGAIHDLMITVEGLPEAMGGSVSQARVHYQRSLELNGGQRAGTHVTWATNISVRQQDRADFEEKLHLALDVDPDAVAEDRLANHIQQRRARFLLSQADELFLEPLEDIDD
jgi:predicted anti-sigma-YlaC factor YlaD